MMFSRRVSQAGGLVFRVTDGRPEILLVRAKKDPSQWIFPKGHIERAESAAEAAIREVREEAGVTGRVVRETGALRFDSGREAVEVKYYLVQACEDVPPAEERARRWLSPADALLALTHDDARRLLRDALPDITEEALLMQAARVEGAPAFTELLLAEYLRVVQRNLVSDRYKRALNRIRRHFVVDAGDPRRVFLAFDPYSRERRSAPSWTSLGRGGWLETVALVESLVAGAFIAALVPTPTWAFEALTATLATLATWVVLLRDAGRRYARGHR